MGIDRYGQRNHELRKRMKERCCMDRKCRTPIVLLALESCLELKSEARSSQDNAGHFHLPQIRHQLRSISIASFWNGNRFRCYYASIGNRSIYGAEGSQGILHRGVSGDCEGFRVNLVETPASISRSKFSNWISRKEQIYLDAKKRQFDDVNPSVLLSDMCSWFVDPWKCHRFCAIMAN